MAAPGRIKTEAVKVAMKLTDDVDSLLGGGRGGSAGSLHPSVDASADSESAGFAGTGGSAATPSQGVGEGSAGAESPADKYLLLENTINEKYRSQKKVDPGSILPPDALLFYIDHPIEFIHDVFHVDPEPWQADMSREIAQEEDGGFVAIAAGSGVGKTFWLSKLIYWFLTTRRGVVPCTAPTEHQLYDILWKELKKDWDSSPLLQQIFTWTQTKLFVNGYVATWYAVARTATVSKGGKVLEGLQGFHDENLMFIIDEASGVADAAMAAVDGALTAHNAKVIMTSNPTRISGRFYNAFTRSRKELGGPWFCMNVDARTSRYVSPKYVKMMLHEHGEDSPVFMAKVSGQFPNQEEMALISLSDIRAAISGIVPAGALQEDAVQELPPARSAKYRSEVFDNEAAEWMTMQYFLSLGLRGLHPGEWPNGRKVAFGKSSYPVGYISRRPVDIAA